MALSDSSYSTRSISLVMLAGLAGLAVWFFMPFGLGGSPSGGEGSPSQLPSFIQVDGPVVAKTEGDDVIGLAVPISMRGDDSIDLAGARLRAETALAETALAAVPASFDIEWTSGDADLVLEPGEQAVLKVALPANSSIRAANPLDLVLVPNSGPTLVLEDVLDR